LRRVKAERREVISPFAQRRHEKFLKGVFEKHKNIKIQTLKQY